MHLKTALISSSLLLGALLLPAHAEDIAPAGEQPIFGRNADKWEIRGGLLSYDTGAFSHQDYSGVVLNGEVVFPSPHFLSVIGSPRPYIGASIAAVDDPVHFFYAGLNWDAYLTDRIYLSTSVGGSINTAENLENPVGYKALGSNVLFHLGAAIGYDITPNTTVQLYADHFSNAGLAEPNNGQESVGVRIGQRF